MPNLLPPIPPPEQPTPTSEELPDVTCTYCSCTYTAEEADENFVNVRNYPGRVCGNCAETYHSTCDHCGDLAENIYMHNIRGRYSARWCDDCAADYAFYCELCDYWFSQEYYTEFRNSWGELCCEDCYYDSQDGDPDCDCEECRPDGLRHGIIQDWDFVPSLTFHGKHSVLDTGPFFGMELETSWPRAGYPADEVTRWWEKHIQRDHAEVLWVKTDSSVTNGYEIVTHPMTFEWAMKNFPFKAFDELTTTYNAFETHSSCGGHIHINKSAFSRGHLWKFIQFHHRLGEFCEMMGGRSSDQWGSLKKGGDWDMVRPMAKEIAMTKYQHNQGRYQGLNFLNDETIELRYPAGGSSGHLIRKNLQLAESVFKFTNEVDVKLFRKGILDDPGYFLWWLKEHKDRYPDLNTYVFTKIPSVKPFPTEETN